MARIAPFGYSEEEDDKKNTLASKLAPTEPVEGVGESLTTPDVAPETKQLATELSSPKSQGYLDQLKQLSTEPGYGTGVSEETRNTLKDAINRAQDAYDAQVSKNEWLDVAQTLGRAVAQFGAAQSGMRTGHDMSNLNMGDKIDYNARSDRALKGYQQSINNAKDLSDLDQKDAASRKEAYNRRYDYLSQGLRNSEQKEAQAEQFRRQEAADAGRDRREALRDQARFNMGEKSETRRDQTAALKDLAGQEKETTQKLQAQLAVLNNTQLMEDVKSNRTIDKLQAQYGNQLGRAGLDLSEVQKTKPGTLWGTNSDPEATRKAIQDKVQETKNLLDSIKERKKQLLTGGQPQQAPVQSNMSTPSAGEPSEDQVDKYVSIYPQVSREQAKQILKDRLSGK